LPKNDLPDSAVNVIHPASYRPKKIFPRVSGDGLFESILNCPDKDELNWYPVNRALKNSRLLGPELLKTA
jgi:hypothetical protein